MGQPYTRQHYVPQFLLRQWHSGRDDMLTMHQSLRGEFVHKRATANQVGFARHIYSTPKPGGQMDTTLEREFMGPVVDGPAAAVHRAILAGGIRSLDAAQRGYWAQFIVSLLLRVPRTMAVLHEKARTILGKHLDKDSEFGRQHDRTTTTRQWVDKHWPEAYAEVALGVMPQLVQSDNLMAQVTKGKWATRTLSPTCRFDLMIGDHPLLYVGALDAAFLLVIPLSPRRAFLYFDDVGTWDNLRRLSEAQFARAVNLHTVSTAARYVYASDDRHVLFVNKHLQALH